MAQDYGQYIHNNLSAYPGIVRDEAVVTKINAMLVALEDAGLDALVSNFCNKQDARDILFEAWIGYLLLKNHVVQSLAYEPSEEQRPPDFRFRIGGVGFDVQVKRLHNTVNEMTKLFFRKECKRRLSQVQNPWFINFWVSDDFERQHLDDFFGYVLANIESFEPAPDPQVALTASQYQWGNGCKVLARFSFQQKNSGRLGISPGVIHESGTADGMASRVDVSAHRKVVEYRLKKAKPTLTKEVSETQSNLVVAQVADNVEMDADDMANVLYGSEGTTFRPTQDGTWVVREHRGPGGLFDGRYFSRICGLVLVPHNATPVDEQLTGDYFPNPTHLHSIGLHPKPFESVMFYVPREWLDESVWEPMGDARFSPPSELWDNTP